MDIQLEGKKLKGRYALIRTGKEGKKFWLFLKKKYEEANSEHDILIERPESVLSGQTLEEISDLKRPKMNKLFKVLNTKL